MVTFYFLSCVQPQGHVVPVAVNTRNIAEVEAASKSLKADMATFQAGECHHFIQHSLYF